MPPLRAKPNGLHARVKGILLLHVKLLIKELDVRIIKFDTRIKPAIALV